MVLATLQKQKAAKESSPAVKIPLPVKNSGSVKSNGEGARSAEVPVELKGNKISISDIRKRPLDQEDTREPLTALTGSTTPKKREIDFTVDWPGAASPAKSSPRDGTAVYKKRAKTDAAPNQKAETTPRQKSVITQHQKTDTTPVTPPLRTSRRKEHNAMSPPPAPVFEPSLRTEEIGVPEAASVPVVELSVELQSLEPIRREPSSSPAKEVRKNAEEEDIFANLKDLDSQELEVETQSFSSFIPKIARRLHGLMNLGNTCYMNVIVQILCNLPSFVNGMERFFGPLVNQNQNAVEGSDSLPFPDIESVHAALLTVFRDLKRAERYETVNPTVLKHAFARHQSSFWGCIQQDAHEFFCSLIDQVQEAVSSELKKKHSIETDRPKLEIVCPTTQNFSCSVRNSLTCAGCGSVSSVEETYRDFCLALPEDERTDESQNCSLESLLNHYFQETIMSRKCEKCGVEDTKAKAQILKLPHVLVLQLKRLHMDRDIPCTKVSAPVKFTSRLDIGPWCAEDKQLFWSRNVEDSGRMYSSCATQNVSCTSDENVDSGMTSVLPSDLSTSYRLHGVVNHLGHHAFGGHFLTDILDPEANRWLRCDDSLVTDVAEESVFANVREAYMFFYVHESAISKSTD